MKTWLMMLPLVCAVNAAMAQGAETGGPAAQTEPVKTQEMARTQENAQTREKATASRNKRQGGDLRHCLDRKTNKEIIRCSEKNRRK